ncbi:hypothetical protein V8C43DRAFT_273694 [Trichoderma afarasin]
MSTGTWDPGLVHSPREGFHASVWPQSVQALLQFDQDCTTQAPDNCQARPGQAQMLFPRMIHVSIPGVFAWVPFAGCTGTDTDTCTGDAAGNLDWYSYIGSKRSRAMQSLMIGPRIEASTGP